MNISGMRKGAALVGLILSIISAIFTIKLLTQFGNDGFEKLIYAVFGGTVQAAQTLLYLYGCFCVWNGRPGKATPALIMWGLLFGLSLVGSVGFFAVTNKTMDITAKESDSGYELLQNEIKAIDSQVESLNAQIKAYASKNIMTHGVKPSQNKINELMAHRQEVTSQLVNYQGENPNNALYDMIGRFFGVSDPERVRFVLFVLYALALDLTSVILLSYSIGILNFMPDAAVPGTGTVQGGFNGGGQPGLNQGGYAGMNPGVSGMSASSQHFGKYGVPGTPYNTSIDTSQHVGTAGTADISEITPDLCMAYIEHLFPIPERRDGSLKSRRKIADELGIKQKAADNIHMMMKKAGYIRIEGSKTYPNYSKDEMLMAVGGIPGNQLAS